MKPSCRVEQLRVNGRTINNHFLIHDRDGATFLQSYNSVVAAKFNGKVYLDNETWDYSKTTGKYRNWFLGEGIAETREKIESGEYELTNLNS